MFVVVTECGAAPIGAGERRACVVAAAELLVAAEAVRDREDPTGTHREGNVLWRLQRTLAAHEACACAAEADYALAGGEEIEPARGLTVALELLDGRQAEGGNALRELVRGTVELAALLVRAVANLDALGDARGAFRAPPATAVARLGAIGHEIARRASGLDRLMRVRRSADPAGHHLSAALHVAVPGEAFDVVGDVGADRAATVCALVAVRGAWLRLAAHELLVLEILEPDPAFRSDD